MSNILSTINKGIKKTIREEGIIHTIAIVTAVPMLVAFAVVSLLFMITTMYTEYGWLGVAVLPILACWVITLVDSL